MRFPLLALGLGVFLIGGIAAAQEPAEPPAPGPSAVAPTPAIADAPPTVHITGPAGGAHAQRLVHVAGTVSDATLVRATLVLNGSPQSIALAAGRFDVEQLLAPGENVIQVWAENGHGAGHDAVVLFSRVPPLDLKVTLTWDTDATDVDLWVTDPRGTKCYYEKTETEIGGRLDIDDTDGYGPETFTLPAAVPGNYLIEADYYADGPGAQTRCRAVVVLYEGTPAEERRSFEFVLTHTGDIARIAALAVGAHR